MAAQIINPLTPLAYLNPSLALQFEASRYLFVGTLGAFLWDWLMSINEEYRMVKKSVRFFPTTIYFISRVATLAYIITSTLFQVARVSNCQSLQIALGICYIFAVPSGAFLFYLRVRAVFHDNRLVQGFFVFLWLTVFGGAMVVPFAIEGVHIGPTHYCINSQVKSFASASIITSTINDSLIFIAISYKLAKDTRVKAKWQEIASSFFKGNDLNTMAKALYQGGQIYYLSTVGMNVLTLVMVMAPSAPPVYHGMFTVPNNALQSVMACRVFRQLKLGMLGNEGGTSASLPNVPLSWRPAQANSGLERSGAALDGKARINMNDVYGSDGMNIKVTRDVELSMDVDNNYKRREQALL